MRKADSRNHKSASSQSRKVRPRSGADMYHVDSDAGLSRHVQRIIRAYRNGGLIQRRGF